MMTIKIEIGLDKEREHKTHNARLRKAAWIAAFADSIIWLVFGGICATLFYGEMLCVYALSFLIVSHVLYLMYLWVKTWFLKEKYGTGIYRETFGNTGFLLVAVSVLILLFECLF